MTEKNSSIQQCTEKINSILKEIKSNNEKKDFPSSCYLQRTKLSDCIKKLDNFENPNQFSNVQDILSLFKLYDEYDSIINLNSTKFKDYLSMCIQNSTYPSIEEIVKLKMMSEEVQNVAKLLDKFTHEKIFLSVMKYKSVYKFVRDGILMRFVEFVHQNKDIIQFPKHIIKDINNDLDNPYVMDVTFDKDFNLKFNYEYFINNEKENNTIFKFVKDEISLSVLNQIQDVITGNEILTNNNNMKNSILTDNTNINNNDNLIIDSEKDKTESHHKGQEKDLFSKSGVTDVNSENNIKNNKSNITKSKSFEKEINEKIIDNAASKRARADEVDDEEHGKNTIHKKREINELKSNITKSKSFEKEINEKIIDNAASKRARDDNEDDEDHGKNIIHKKREINELKTIISEKIQTLSESDDEMQGNNEDNDGDVIHSKRELDPKEKEGNENASKINKIHTNMTH